MTAANSPDRLRLLYYVFAIPVAIQAGLAIILLFLMMVFTLAEEPLLSLAAALMMAGCIGAFSNLSSYRDRKLDRTNFWLLVSGVVGVVVLSSYVLFWFAPNSQIELGWTLFFTLPSVHAIVSARLCFLRMKRNDGAYFLKPWEITPNPNL